MDALNPGDAACESGRSRRGRWRSQWLLASFPAAIGCGLLACAAAKWTSRPLQPRSGESRFLIADFERCTAGWPPPSPWQHRTFDGVPPTGYRIVEDRDGKHLHGEAEAGASALVVAIDAEPSDLRRLHFRWRAPILPDGADLRRRAGDDCALRVFVTFEYEPGRASLGERIARSLTSGDLPGSSLCYVCTADSESGSVMPNAFTSRTQMIVLPGAGAAWTTFECDLVADYVRAFGHAPPRITGVGVMVDADQTRSRSAADIDDIELLSGREADVGSPAAGPATEPADPRSRPYK